MQRAAYYLHEHGHVGFAEAVEELALQVTYTEKEHGRKVIIKVDVHVVYCVLILLERPINILRL